LSGLADVIKGELAIMLGLLLTIIEVLLIGFLVDCSVISYSLLEMRGNSLISLEKYGCLRASEAVIRVFGLLSNILLRRSNAILV
jgi:hypothetical protein